MSKKEQDIIAVILLNLGGPEKLEDVEPFLLNLFSDRKIIRLGPSFMQKFIARRIVKKRAPKSRETYRLIGGGSPLARITAEQGAALEGELSSVASFKSHPSFDVGGVNSLFREIRLDTINGDVDLEERLLYIGLSRE